ncbi:MAG: TVP38/TMEM64 family protein [Deltaproteobacteria bacterium]|nr:TVP38/TMEM64 family protein [Deltaproteobacteria bacterium]
MEANPSRWRALRKRLVVLFVVLAALVGTQILRRQMGIEFSASSIQQTVAEFGIWAPLGYILLVILRQTMALPSGLMLTVAGLLFGASIGTLIGGVGLTLNAFALFSCARLLGRDWVQPQIHSRFPDFEERARTAGPLFIAFMTGHPMGLLTPFHFAAGITQISWFGFLLAVGPAAVLRAACYAFLGANLLDPGSPRFWLASGVLLVVAFLPLAHPGLRSRLLRGNDTQNRVENEPDEQPVQNDPTPEARAVSTR